MPLSKIVAVTGAAGLLGRAVVEELRHHAIGVRPIDRHPRASEDRADFVLSDLRNTEAVGHALAGCTDLVHLAALPTPNAADTTTVWSENTTIAGNVLFLAREHGIANIVVASSQSVLGLPYAARVTSPDYLPVDEDHPIRPADAYSASKAATELLAAAIGRDGEASVSCLRFPVIWNAADHAACVARRLGNPAQGAKSLWAYIDVRDAARAVRLALDRPAVGCRMLNVTSCRPFISEPPSALVARWFPDLKDLRVPLDAHTAPFDWRRADAAIGFRSRYAWTESGITDLETALPA